MPGDILSHPLFWQYASIPLIAALIGWITNWLAIKMTFQPLEFIGIRPFLGWQGIIPSKAAKMADIAVDATIAKLGTVSEIFAQIDPTILAEYIVHSHLPRIEEYVDEIMLAEYPTLWENLPDGARKFLYQRVTATAPKLVERLIQDINLHADSLFDLKGMVKQQLTADKALLNRMFQECGVKEFRFIIHSGLWLGFLFGLLQTGIWILLPADWTLPLCGLIVGLGTNWIALNIIFRPLQPRKIGPFTLQGLFLKRQKEVAGTFCRLVTHEILTVDHIVEAMLSGPQGDRTRALIQKHVKPLVDETAGLGKPLTQIVMGPKGFADLKHRVGEKAVQISRSTFSNRMFNEDRANAVETIMRERMEALRPDEFQQLLRPCFQED
jgi:uncharacterized membrane protein YheB (UPF0754 family)